MNTTPEERAALRARHIQAYNGACSGCLPYFAWPCIALRLLDDIEDLQLRLDAVHTIKGVANGVSNGVSNGADQVWYDAAETRLTK